MPIDQELQNAISKAHEQLSAEVAAAGVETPVEETPEETTEESVEEETPESDDEPQQDDELDEAALKEAKTLYKALRDDPQGSVRQLMSAAGIELPKDIKPETPAEERAAKRAITEILKEKLGESMSFLAKPLSEALDEILSQERQEIDDVRQNTETIRVESEVVRVTEKLATETKGESRKYEKRMMELADKIHPSPNTTVEEYIRTLYTLASAGSQKTTIQKSLADKIRRNASDTPSRLRAGGGEVRSDEGLSKKRGLHDSVMFAIGQLEKQGRRNK